MSKEERRRKRKHARSRSKQPRLVLDRAIDRNETKRNETKTSTVIVYSRKKKSQAATVPVVTTAAAATAPTEAREEEEKEKEEPEKKKPKRESLFEQLMSKRKSPQKGKEKEKKKRKRKEKEKEKPRGKIQTILDFGQANIGTTTCGECGLTFSRGTEDEKLHEKFHLKETAPVHFAGWKKKAKVVREYAEDGTAIVVCPVSERELGTADKALKKAVEDVREMIDRALGFVSEEGNERRARTTSAERGSEKMFVLIDRGGRALGGVIAERVNTAHRVVVGGGGGCGGGGGGGGGDDGTETVTCRNKEEPAVAGVSRIWVHPTARRRGIATKLLEAMREEFIYAYEVLKEELAFSQPTPDGMQFFRKYTGTNEFLVYS